MPINFNLIEQKFYNQFNNGDNYNLNTSDYTTNLNGAVGENIKVIQKVKVSWLSSTSAINEFSINGNTLTQQNGDFTQDGFVLGDVIDIWDTSVPSAIVQDRTIVSISALQIEFDGASAGTNTYTDAKVYGKTFLKSLVFKYGLIENNEGTNFISKIDTVAENRFYASGIGVDTGGGVRDTSPVTMIATTGVNSWKDGGSAVVNYDSTLTQSGEFAQIFQIEHIFTILPYYLDSELTNLQNKVPPALFNSSNTLKYVIDAELTESLSNPNTAKNVVIDYVGGSVGWFEENYNGFANQYSFTNLSYLVGSTPINEIDAKNQTDINFILRSSDNTFTVNSRVSIGISWLPISSQYQQNLNDIDTNFLKDYIIHTVGTTSSSSIITNYQTTLLTAGRIEVDLSIEYALSDQPQLQNGYYLLWCTTSDPSEITKDTDKVALIIDVNQYKYDSDVYDLMFVDEMKFYAHDQDENASSYYNDYAGWVEDGYLLEIPFKLNTDESASLDSLQVKLSAYNSTTEDLFDISTYNIDLSGAVQVGNTQQINLSSTNNYKLLDTDQFKQVELTTGSAGTQGLININNYTLKVGLRLNFEEWILLSSANSIFYDNTQLNNGLNLLSSNYSNSNGYQLVINLDAQVKDVNNTVTNYKFLSNDLTSKYYDTGITDPPKWECQINTFDDTGLQIDTIYNNDTTFIKAFFSLTSGLPTNLVRPFGWLRLDVLQGDINTPYELSTINLPLVTNSPLKALSGETYAKLTDTGSQIIIEGRIDHTLLPAGSKLSITARLSDSNVPSFELITCEGSFTVYIDLDLTAYIGQYIILNDGTCYLVVGASGETPTITGKTLLGAGYGDCGECNASLKRTESGSIKTMESGDFKIIE